VEDVPQRTTIHADETKTSDGLLSTVQVQAVGLQGWGESGQRAFARHRHCEVLGQAWWLQPTDDQHVVLPGSASE
jgi:hypothetical protein